MAAPALRAARERRILCPVLSARPGLRHDPRGRRRYHVQSASVQLWSCVSGLQCAPSGSVDIRRSTAAITPSFLHDKIQLKSVATLIKKITYSRLGTLVFDTKRFVLIEQYLVM